MLCFGRVAICVFYSRGDNLIGEFVNIIAMDYLLIIWATLFTLRKGVVSGLP